MTCVVRRYRIAYHAAIIATACIVIAECGTSSRAQTNRTTKTDQSEQQDIAVNRFRAIGDSIVQGSLLCTLGQKRYCLPRDLWRTPEIIQAVNTLNACMYPIGLNSIGLRRSSSTVRENVAMACKDEIKALISEMTNEKVLEEDGPSAPLRSVEEWDREQARQSKIVQTYVLDSFINDYERSLRRLAGDIEERTKR